MKVAVSGPSGFIGGAIIKQLVSAGHLVNFLTRETFNMPPEEFLENKIEGVDAVVHFAGTPLVRRWNTRAREEILDSRVGTTRKIANAILQARNKPRVFISGSAIGIYDQEHRHTDESTDYDTGFLADVCRQWEEAASLTTEATRLVILRCGVVIGDGGMIGRVQTPFSIGAGAKIGSGDQSFSFIHLDDLVAIVMTALTDGSMSGIYNATAPWPTTNYHFSETLGKVLNQPVFLTVPAFLLRWIYGEAAETMIRGQKVIPARLEQQGFEFKYPTIEKALLAVFR
jgi:uncharacterized protein (TIGR01777 family)